MTAPPGFVDRVPLRIKLVAASLGLVIGALCMIGVANTIALRSYLVGRVDLDLYGAVDSFRSRQFDDPACPVPGKIRYIPTDVPSDFAVAMAGGTCIDLYVSPIYRDRQLPNLDKLVNRQYGGPYTVHSRDGSVRWRIIVIDLEQGPPMAVGEDLSKVDNAVQRLILINLLVGAGVVITLTMVGVWLVRVSLRPLAEIEGTAAAIARGELTRRVPDLDPRTEVGRLGHAFNAMLAQIEGAFQARATSETRARKSEERMRQFVADASHELRTPLTTIRGFAELYRQGATEDVDGVLLRIEAEAERMGLLVEDLLLLARLDQERPLELAPVGLSALVTDAGAAIQAIAPDRAVDITVPDEDLVVLGDEPRLRQVIGNLITNALTHTPAGTSVWLHLRPDGTDALIEVADSGPGLDAEQSTRVFERFYRVDKARARSAAGTRITGRPGGIAPHSGTGLGLAIVAALVAAHNGSVEVDSQPGLGATFRVRLPLAPAEPPVDAPADGPADSPVGPVEAPAEDAVETGHSGSSPPAS